MKASEYLAKMFKAYGVSHVFYQEMMFLSTMRDCVKEGVQPICAHSEFAAGYMADGYSRVSGKPGVCAAQAIGSPNLAAAIHDAYLGCTPLVAITGKKPPSFQYRNAYQDSEHMPLFAPLTKFSASLTDPVQTPFLLRQAFKEATSGKPRPVHLDILGFAAIELESADIDEPVFADTTYSVFPPFRPAAEAALVTKAVKEIDKAKKPIMVVGRGAISSHAEDAVKAFAEKGTIPVVTSCDGKSIIDEDHALWLGIVGGYGMESANKAVAASDLVIYVGTQTSDQNTLDWQVPAPGTRVIQIDIDPAEIGRSYPNCVALPGDARTVLEQLIEGIKPAKRDTWRKQLTTLQKDQFAKHEERFASSSSPIDVARLCHEVSKALPDNGILVADTGWSAVWTACMLRMKASQTYIRAAGTLGWSFPASLGAKCGAPDRPVINFTGDGAFYYCMGEMETAMRYGINTVTVINNNLSFGQIIPPAVQLSYSDKPQDGVERYSFKQVNFAKVAEEFGLWAKRVEKAEDIGPALKEALACGRPALVEVMTDKNSAPFNPMG